MIDEDYRGSICDLELAQLLHKARAAYQHGLTTPLGRMCPESILAAEKAHDRVDAIIEGRDREDDSTEDAP